MLLPCSSPWQPCDFRKLPDSLLSLPTLGCKVSTWLLNHKMWKRMGSEGYLAGGERLGK